MWGIWRICWVLFITGSWLPAQTDSLTFHGRPNDPAFVRQDNLARAGFPELWGVTTGGLTPDGAEIVIAVMDAGFDAAHEDLIDNLWTNPGEIPDDGIDNDGNGYVDDLHGWNFRQASGKFGARTPHGTQVAGIIGAVGDNAVGIAGTNWRTRLLLLNVATSTDVVAAYDYLYDLRARYNRSDGREGALVVVVNTSFGVEGGRCADFAGWASRIELAGEVGVLTVASVANNGRDLDRVGDMPASCPSTSLITVGNVDRDNRLYDDSGYGRTAVDLAAPGEFSYTTRPGDGYGGFGGTSAAAAYVTGAVGLLYGMDCPPLHDPIPTAPAFSAQMVRQAILEGVQAEPSLEFRTSSGGRLDAMRAAQALLRRCADHGDEGQLAIASAFPNPAPTGGSVRLQVSGSFAADRPFRGWISDAVGRRAKLSVRLVGAVPLVIEADLPRLPPGSYQLLIEQDDVRAYTHIVLH